MRTIMLGLLLAFAAFQAAVSSSTDAEVAALKARLTAQQALLVAAIDKNAKLAAQVAELEIKRAATRAILEAP